MRLRQGLIAGEVALTVVLLAAAGLLIRTLIHLQTMPPGFNPTGVMTAKASLDDVRYHDPAAFRKLLNESLAAMREIPGVQNAAVGLTLPYERALISMVTLSDGKQAGRQIARTRCTSRPVFRDLADSGAVGPGVHGCGQVRMRSRWRSSTGLSHASISKARIQWGDTSTKGRGSWEWWRIRCYRRPQG